MLKTSLLIRWLLGCSIALGLASPSLAATASPVVFVSGTPGVATDTPNLLLVALPLRNVGTAPALNVQVKSATLVNSTLLAPALPQNLGTLPTNDGAIVNLQFDAGALLPGVSYRLTVSGTYQVAGVTYGFSVNRNVAPPPASPGLAKLRTGNITSVIIDPGHYPVPAGGTTPPEQEGSNPIGIVVPASPRVILPLGTPASGDQAAGSASPSVGFPINTPFGKSGGSPVDPSGATASTANAAQVVLNTGNTYASVSIDGGATFTNLNPFCMFGFDTCDAAGNPIGAALVDGDLCCDQVIQYVPAIGSFVWLMQTWPTGNVRGTNGATTTPGNNRLRLVIVSPDQVRNWALGYASNWLVLDLTSGLFSLGTNGWMDYPDLAVGNNFLYVSVDRLGSGSGLIVARIALNQLTAAQNVTVEFTDPANSLLAHGSHITQNTGDSVFWAGHNGTGQLRVFNLPESGNTYAWRDVNINPYVNTTASYTSKTPTIANWLGGANPVPPNKGFALEEVIGAVRVPVNAGLCPPGQTCTPPADELWFAWGAGLNTAAGRAQPYVEVVHLDSGDFSVKQQMHIWNSGYAFGYPAFTHNPRGDVAVSLGVGGPDREAHTSVGFMGDFQVWALSTSDSSGARYGDYGNVRPAGWGSNLFSAVGWGIVKGLFDPHFVIFGRPCDVDPTACPGPR